MSTETKRGGNSEKLDSHLAFLDVSHTVTLQAQNPCAVRVKVQLPKLVQGSDDHKAKIFPLKNDFVVEETEDFVDPDTDSATNHIVNDGTVAILRMVAQGGGASSTTSFSYRIQWQDNLVTSTAGRGGLFDSAPGGLFDSAVPPAGFRFGAPGPSPAGTVPPTFGASGPSPPAGAAPSPFGAPGPSPPAGTPYAEESPQTQPQEKEQQRQRDEDRSWVEAGSLPVSKEFSSFQQQKK